MRHTPPKSIEGVPRCEGFDHKCLWSGLMGLYAIKRMGSHPLTVTTQPLLASIPSAGKGCDTVRKPHPTPMGRLRERISPLKIRLQDSSAKGYLARCILPAVRPLYSHAVDLEPSTSDFLRSQLLRP